jgi:hypothetical protein
MTIYPPRAAPFDCAICGKRSPSKWQNLSRMAVRPVCYSCERDWGGGSGLPAQMDDRLTRQINALASAIHWTAISQQHKWALNHAPS